MLSPSDSSDSGSVHGQKSSSAAVKSSEKPTFSNTCNLLSRYLKQKGSFADLGIEMPRFSFGNDTHHRQPATTMNLFPSGEIQKKDELRVVKSPEPEKAKMTIFYGGQVVVFEDFPADKAKEVMLLASNGSSSSVVESIHPVPSPATPIPTPTNALAQDPPQTQRIVTDLPIKRKASLARFLEKRKDRLTARAPYSVEKPTSSAADPTEATESRPWLGLSA